MRSLGLRTILVWKTLKTFFNFKNLLSCFECWVLRRKLIISDIKNTIFDFEMFQHFWQELLFIKIRTFPISGVFELISSKLFGMAGNFASLYSPFSAIHLNKMICWNMKKVFTDLIWIDGCWSVPGWRGSLAIDMDAISLILDWTSTLERFLDNGLLGLMVVAGVAPVLDPGRDV